MSDDYKREEKVERKEEPGKVGSTFIKYAFITVITLIILFFIVNYLMPMFPGGDGDGGGGDDNTINVEIDGNLDGDGNNGGNEGGD
ncbi:hypothetical protein [Salipaludibacillus daqingensis]|uniref:hypothetical protein n=1 Tax=Salipaludibacillus daqingensis TaxID=3041001 RepID=UPI0024742EEC|nr:hypothetical protein [Salipaludibacillus daqingensis]